MTLVMGLRTTSFRNPFAVILQANLVGQLTTVQNDWAKRLVDRAEKYPRRRRGQVYVRTFTFRDNWRITPSHLTAGGLESTVENDTGYAVSVVGNDEGLLQNAKYHKGRWYLFRDLVAQSEAQARAEAQAVLNEVLAPARMGRR